jgi:hypothetical protein
LPFPWPFPLRPYPLLLWPLPLRPLPLPFSRVRGCGRLTHMPGEYIVFGSS